MRRHLVDPCGHAGVRIAREDGHRPLVVTRTLLRVPGRGISRTIVDEVQTGIVGQPAPCAAAADLPLIALPGLEARIPADRLAEFGGLLGVEHELVVRTFRKGPPYLFAGLEIIGRDVALHAKFTARNTDQAFLLHDEPRRNSGTTDAGVAILGR